MRTILALAGGALLAACNGLSAHEMMSGDPVPAVGEGSERSFDASGFTEVALRGPDNVEVRAGDGFSVRAEGNADSLDRLDIRIDGDRLLVGRLPERAPDWDNGRVTVYVTMPRIVAASVAGSGDMSVDTAQADEFDASIAGSGDLSIGELRATSVDLSIAGSGDLAVAGTAQEIDANIAGSGNIAADNLRAERLSASIAGSGNVDAYVVDEADASLIGSGNVNVRGGATCSSNSIGSGKLTCRG